MKLKNYLKIKINLIADCGIITLKDYIKGKLGDNCKFESVKAC